MTARWPPCTGTPPPARSRLRLSGNTHAIVAMKAHSCAAIVALSGRRRTTTSPRLSTSWLRDAALARWAPREPVSAIARVAQPSVRLKGTSRRDAEALERLRAISATLTCGLSWSDLRESNSRRLKDLPRQSNQKTRSKRARLLTRSRAARRPLPQEGWPRCAETSSCRPPTVRSRGPPSLHTHRHGLRRSGHRAPAGSRPTSWCGRSARR